MMEEGCAARQGSMGGGDEMVQLRELAKQLLKVGADIEDMRPVEARACAELLDVGSRHTTALQDEDNRAERMEEELRQLREVQELAASALKQRSNKAEPLGKRQEVSSAMYNWASASPAPVVDESTGLAQAQLLQLVLYAWTEYRRECQQTRRHQAVIRRMDAQRHRAERGMLKGIVVAWAGHARRHRRAVLAMRHRAVHALLGMVLRSWFSYWQVRAARAIRVAALVQAKQVLLKDRLRRSVVYTWREFIRRCRRLQRQQAMVSRMAARWEEAERGRRKGLICTWREFARQRRRAVQAAQEKAAGAAFELLWHAWSCWRQACVVRSAKEGAVNKVTGLWREGHDEMLQKTVLYAMAAEAFYNRRLMKYQRDCQDHLDRMQAKQKAAELEQQIEARHRKERTERNLEMLVAQWEREEWYGLLQVAFRSWLVHAYHRSVVAHSRACVRLAMLKALDRMVWQLKQTYFGHWIEAVQAAKPKSANEEGQATSKEIRLAAESQQVVLEAFGLVKELLHTERQALARKATRGTRVRRQAPKAARRIPHDVEAEAVADPFVSSWPPPPAEEEDEQPSTVPEGFAPFKEEDEEDKEVADADVSPPLPSAFVPEKQAEEEAEEETSSSEASPSTSTSSRSASPTSRAFGFASPTSQAFTASLPPARAGGRFRISPLPNKYPCFGPPGDPTWSVATGSRSAVVAEEPPPPAYDLDSSDSDLSPPGAVSSTVLANEVAPLPPPQDPWELAAQMVEEGKVKSPPPNEVEAAVERLWGSNSGSRASSKEELPSARSAQAAEATEAIVSAVSERLAEVESLSDSDDESEDSEDSEDAALAALPSASPEADGWPSASAEAAEPLESGWPSASADEDPSLTTEGFAAFVDEGAEEPWGSDPIASAAFGSPDEAAQDAEAADAFSSGWPAASEQPAEGSWGSVPITPAAFGSAPDVDVVEAAASELWEVVDSSAEPEPALAFPLEAAEESERADPFVGGWPEATSMAPVDGGAEDSWGSEPLAPAPFDSTPDVGVVEAVASELWEASADPADPFGGSWPPSTEQAEVPWGGDPVTPAAFSSDPDAGVVAAVASDLWEGSDEPTPAPAFPPQEFESSAFSAAPRDEMVEDSFASDPIEPVAAFGSSPEAGLVEAVASELWDEVAERSVEPSPVPPPPPQEFGDASETFKTVLIDEIAEDLWGSGSASAEPFSSKPDVGVVEAVAAELWEAPAPPVAEPLLQSQEATDSSDPFAAADRSAGGWPPTAEALADLASPSPFPQPETIAESPGEAAVIQEVAKDLWGPEPVPSSSFSTPDASVLEAVASELWEDEEFQTPVREPEVETPIEDGRVGCEICKRRFPEDQMDRHVRICRRVFSRGGSWGPEKSSSSARVASPTRLLQRQKTR